VPRTSPLSSTVLTLCLAEGLTLIGVFAFPALMPDFKALWRLTNAQAGWIAGVYFLGYALAVPVLTSLTDRIDAKRVFIAGIALCALASAGFAWMASGLWTAMAFRALGGVGLAGVYMPGLKALIDRSPAGEGQARSISFYTASFSLGTMLSFMVIGEAALRLGWQGAFLLSAACALAGLALALRLKPVPPPPCAAAGGGLLDFRPVLANRAAMGYILGYVCHMWELFTFRAWTVAFLAFAQAHAGGGGWAPTSVATVCSLAAMAASLGGADLAIRFDRRKVCAVAMFLSGGMALVVGLTAALPYWAAAVAAVVYNGLVQIDSAALTTGAMMAAAVSRRGSTAALHSLLGFSAAFFGPLAQGSILDRVGSGTVAGWTIAFAAMGGVGLLGPLALAWSRPR